VAADLPKSDLSRIPGWPSEGSMPSRGSRRKTKIPNYSGQKKYFLNFRRNSNGCHFAWSFHSREMFPHFHHGSCFRRNASRRPSHYPRFEPTQAWTDRKNFRMIATCPWRYENFAPPLAKLRSDRNREKLLTS
jgi:hypothetical protein